MPLVTTLGNRGIEQIKGILPHEHIFTDIRQGSPPGFGQGDAQAVIRLVAADLEALLKQGMDVLVEATPVGVGRRADILKAVSEILDFPFVVPTGLYREEWIPRWAIDATQDDLQNWMERELLEEIENTGVRAGWIKLGASDTGLTATEEKILRAAARAAKSCQCAIGSHTIHGGVASRQLDIIEEEGYDPSRFIWIHTQAEPDQNWHRQLAARGAWLEYDAIGSEIPDRQFILWLTKALDAGFGRQLLISQDRGWYDPAHPTGESFRSYTYLSETFVPEMRQHGLDSFIDQLVRINPYAAFCRK